MRLLAVLGSLKLTLVAFALLLADILLNYRAELRSPWPLAVPLALLSLNLLCAVASNPVFRRQTALLVFHLALGALVLLIALGQLTYLRGQLELSTGETFSGQLSESQRGPWHAGRLGEVAFTSLGYTIEYGPGLRRNQTRNWVRWRDSAGEYRAVVGDQQALSLHGYRFYTSHNKGFAPVFLWRAADGTTDRGTVHLPSYPINEFAQAREWSPPGTDAKLWVMLDIDEVLLDPKTTTQFRLPGKHTLVLREGDGRHELEPGDRYAVAGGELVYEGLTTWMGYNVFYDWTLPWLLASCLVAVASLAWHFWSKFSRQAWDA